LPRDMAWIQDGQVLVPFEIPGLKSCLCVKATVSGHATLLARSVPMRSRGSTAHSHQSPNGQHATLIVGCAPRMQGANSSGIGKPRANTNAMMPHPPSVGTVPAGTRALHQSWGPNQGTDWQNHLGQNHSFLPQEARMILPQVTVPIKLLVNVVSRSAAFLGRCPGLSDKRPDPAPIGPLPKARFLPFAGQRHTRASRLRGKHRLGFGKQAALAERRRRNNKQHGPCG